MSKEIHEILGSKIKKLRQSRDLTASQLAEMIGVSRTTISKFENGISGVSLENYYKIVSALACDDMNHIFPLKKLVIDEDLNKFMNAKH